MATKATATTVATTVNTATTWRHEHPATGQGGY